MSWQIEVTDTFGGEANYCWVKRQTLPVTLTPRQLVRRAKAFAGFTGMRCRVENFGDSLQITPSGLCQVCFVTWSDYVEAQS